MDEYLRRAHDALQECAEGLSLEQITLKPSGKWTIAEILEHLGRAFSGTEAGARRVLARGRPAARRADFPTALRIWLVVECGYMPAGRRAPAMTLPQGIDPAIALGTALENLTRMDAALSDAAAQFGAGVKLMDHPILGPLSTRQWRRFHWVHTWHHVRQIRARQRG